MLKKAGCKLGTARRPGWPRKQGRAGILTQDDKRNGAPALCAALNKAGWHRPRRPDEPASASRAAEVLETQWTQRRPRGRNGIASWTTTRRPNLPRVKSWPAQPPRFHLPLTPPRAAWLNRVGRCFRDFTAKRLRRGVFQSLPALTDAMSEYIRQPHAAPKTFRLDRPRARYSGESQARARETP